MCGVERDLAPYIISIEDGYVCAVNDAETCEEMHINAEGFAVTPSFSCRVVVSIAPMLAMQGLRKR